MSDNLAFLEKAKSLFVKGDSDNGLPPPLIAALETCRNANLLRDELMQASRDLQLELKKEGRTDELEAEEYACDLLNWTLTAAFDEANRRLDYIKSLDTQSKREQELTRCANGTQGTLHFINHWVWTNDSRKPLAMLPFKLFQYQEHFIGWLEDLTFKYRQPGLCYKARDVGATWGVVSFLVKNWRFKPFFTALVVSKSEDFTDSKGREDTLMEKIRIIIRHLPTWMLPKEFNIEKHMPWLNILNPNGSYIAGDSSNPNVGRSGRYSFLLLDEFQIFPEGGFAVATSCSQAAPTRLFLGTPAGMLNKFYDLHANSKIRQIELKWEDHPWKDARWYRAQDQTMTPAEKAQELDRDWEASQVGLVCPEWQPIYSVITWTEFAAFFGDKAIDEDGKPRIPLDWLLMMSMDVGNSPGHRWLNTWAARPAQRDPLSDSVFLYREFMAPLDMTPSVLGECIVEFERRYKEYRRMSVRYIGHTDTTEVMTFGEQYSDDKNEYSLDFTKRDTDYNGGISAMRNYMRVVELDKPNPIRGYLINPTTNEPLKGRARWYVIVDDKQGMPRFDRGMNKFTVAEPVDNAGFARARVEVQMYHYPESEKGKPVKLQRPAKMVDDAMDTWRDVALELPPIAGLTDNELLERALPPHLQRSALVNVDPSEMAQAWLTRQMEVAQVELPVEEHWRRKMYHGKKKRI